MRCCHVPISYWVIEAITKFSNTKLNEAHMIYIYVSHHIDHGTLMLQGAQEMHVGGSEVECSIGGGGSRRRRGRRGRQILKENTLEEENSTQNVSLGFQLRLSEIGQRSQSNIKCEESST